MDMGQIHRIVRKILRIGVNDERYMIHIGRLSNYKMGLLI